MHNCTVHIGLDVRIPFQKYQFNFGHQFNMKILILLNLFQLFQILSICFCHYVNYWAYLPWTKSPKYCTVNHNVIENRGGVGERDYLYSCFECKRQRVEDPIIMSVIFFKIKENRKIVLR